MLRIVSTLLDISIWYEHREHHRQYRYHANTIKIQIWVTLIANLLLSLLQSSLERRWSFSGLATTVRIVLMNYLNIETFFNKPDEDLKLMLMEASEPPPEDETNP